MLNTLDFTQTTFKKYIYTVYVYFEGISKLIFCQEHANIIHIIIIVIISVWLTGLFS